MHTVFLQVMGFSTITSSALIIPFLAMSSISSTAVNAAALKYGYVRAICTCGIAVIPIGMVTTRLMSTLNEKSSVSRIVGYSAPEHSGVHTGFADAQVGLPADELSTVMALVGAAPTLGGMLGVAVVGTVINNAYRQIVQQSSVTSSFIAKSPNTTISLNPLDVVSSISLLPLDSPTTSAKPPDRIAKCLCVPWRQGCYTLVGVAGLQLVLCVMMRRVEFNDSSSKKDDIELEHLIGVAVAEP
ncbi:hypothetical protein BT96DRAFT_881910 [Gymnopus androsaceus JB14]|uniref:MFS general substrate transporter n=1 Tax=Gymnopus androsaceus JB14 TaxID=1447944 RepID=A0A6A4HNL0_9AGAR|nr:hypothetical protein BT96DRAFT_881910 [Gymnopus androsaceus JB14]